MRIPARVRDLDTVSWLDQPTVDFFGQAIDATTHTLTYFLRASVSGAGETILGTAQGSEWLFGWQVNESISNSSVYYWQAVSQSIADATKTTLGSGSLVIDPSLAYSGTPGVFDGRSQAQKDLDAVQSAIRSMVAGGAVSKYTIGNRRLEKLAMVDLLQLEGKLKADVAREKQAEMIANGLGSPRNLFVRFNA